MANEKRLIDANAPMIKEYFNPQLIDYREFVKKCNHFYENPPFPHPATPWRKGLQLAVEIAIRLPKVDAVEVVRCKDCKHWHEETGWCYHHSHFIDSDGEACHPWESNDWKMFDEDYFCKDGERKDNERKAD